MTRRMDAANDCLSYCHTTQLPKVYIILVHTMAFKRLSNEHQIGCVHGFLFFASFLIDIQKMLLFFLTLIIKKQSKKTSQNNFRVIFFLKKFTQEKNIIFSKIVPMIFSLFLNKKNYQKQYFVCHCVCVFVARKYQENELEKNLGISMETNNNLMNPNCEIPPPKDSWLGYHIITLVDPFYVRTRV